MPMKTFQEKIEELLTCSICLEFFNNPKTLSCGHVFCQSCLEDISERMNWRLRCPFCRNIDESVTNRDDIEKLNSSLCIKQALDILETNDNEDRPTSLASTLTNEDVESFGFLLDYCFLCEQYGHWQQHCRYRGNNSSCDGDSDESIIDSTDTEEIDDSQQNIRMDELPLHSTIEALDLQTANKEKFTKRLQGVKQVDVQREKSFRENRLQRHHSEEVSSKSDQSEYIELYFTQRLTLKNLRKKLFPCMQRKHLNSASNNSCYDNNCNKRFIRRDRFYKEKILLNNKMKQKSDDVDSQPTSSKEVEQRVNRYNMTSMLSMGLIPYNKQYNNRKLSASGSLYKQRYNEPVLMSRQTLGLFGIKNLRYV